MAQSPKPKTIAIAAADAEFAHNAADGAADFVEIVNPMAALD